MGRIAVAMNRVVILSLLVPFSIGNNHINSGCTITDNTIYFGDHVNWVTKVPTFTVCATLCREHADCSYWSLFKKGQSEGICDFFRSIKGGRKQENVISGSKECGEENDTVVTTATVTTTTVTTAVTTATVNTIFYGDHVNWVAK